jgi:uncharacterized protein YqjF (DUF2071 family)
MNEPTYPLRSWVWSQHWRDLLFLHWRVERAALLPHVPDPLEVALHNGDAWVSLVLFRLRVRPRWLPFLPGFSDLVEVNLRTYVRCHGKQGIWFLSVHADNRRAIRVARLLTPMPYAHAVMRYRRVGQQFQFRAWQDSTPGTLAAFTFLPTGTTREPTPHSLDEWLLERYRLFAHGRRTALVWAEVAHPRWAASGVTVSISANGFGGAVGLDLSHTPERAHFSAGAWARFGSFRRLEGNWPNQLPQQPVGAGRSSEIQSPLRPPAAKVVRWAETDR